MDTRSKKWKIAISFLLFFTGVTLLINSVFSLITLFYMREEIDFFETDYQNTNSFKQTVTDYMDNFFSMAVNGSVNMPSYYEPNTIEQSIEEAESYYMELKEKGAFKKDAETLHKLYQEDKNLLYQITYENKVKYSNVPENQTLDGPSQAYPQEYNFFLYFDGEKAMIQKDGKNIDFYGDGYYEEGDWYLPGYKNFIADDELKKATVTIAVLKNPKYFIKTNYENRYQNYGENRLYWISEGLKDNKRDFYFSLVSLGIGILLLLACIPFRKSKKEADHVLAGITGRFIFEAKIILFLLIPLLLILLPGMREFTYLLTTEIYWNFSVFYWNFFQISSFSVMISFWLVYLFINDIRYGKTPWKNNLLSLFQRIEQKLPMERRLFYSYLCSFLVAFVIPIALLIFTFLAAPNNILIQRGISASIILLNLSLLWFLYVRSQKLTEKLAKLRNHIKLIRNGNLKEPLILPDEDDLQEIAKDLNEIQSGMETALEKQMQSERMKVELITNVSHDVKTPLTSIVSYVDLLRQEENLPDTVKDYVKILEMKSQRLQSMVQDVFEVSKAASGELSVNLEDLDICKLLRQTIADMQEEISQSSVTLREHIPEKPVIIHADGQRIYRVFQNLLQNALRYSLDSSRVYIKIEDKNDLVSIRIQNTSKNEIPAAKNLADRFVRGDESRTDDGSGLGLSIASSFTEACGGNLQIETVADLFTVSVTFPVVPQNQILDTANL